MQNENVENQSGQVKKNPSRDNKNINQQGQNNEKRFDNKTDPKRDAEINPSKLDRHEVDLDRGGVSNSSGGNVGNQGDRKSQQNLSGQNAGGNEQAQSQGLQNSRGAQGSNSQGQTEQQQAEPKSGDTKTGVKNEGMKTASGEGYNANEQFDEDEDFGSNVQGASGEEGEGRQNASGGQGTLNNMQKNQFEQRQKDKNQENSTRQ